MSQVYYIYRAIPGRTCDRQRQPMHTPVQVSSVTHVTMNHLRETPLPGYVDEETRRVNTPFTITPIKQTGQGPSTQILAVDYTSRPTSSMNHLRETPLPGYVDEETRRVNTPFTITPIKQIGQGPSTEILAVDYTSRPTSSRGQVFTYHGSVTDGSSVDRMTPGYYCHQEPHRNGINRTNISRRINFITVARLSNTSSEGGSFSRLQYCRLSSCHLASLALVCNPVIGICALYYAGKSLVSQIDKIR